MQIATTNQSMTSREIADLVEKRHDSVKRTIETLINQGVIESPQTVEIPTATRPTKAYLFTADHKRDTYVVVAQLSPEFTARIVDRWQELEAEQSHAIDPAPTTPLLPSTQAKQLVVDTLDIANLFRVPLHIGQQESVKAARLQTGIDFAPLLAHAPAQTDVPAFEVMLEPTELAQRLGVKNARAMNAILRDYGLQVKINSEWEPTEDGKPLCVKHAWVKGDKSGYNLKWRLTSIRKMMKPKLVEMTA